MKQLVLRKWHRRIGITLAFFIILQTGSGLALLIEDQFFGEEERSEGHGHEHEVQGHENNWVAALHHGVYPLGIHVVYRSLLALGIMGMAISG